MKFVVQNYDYSLKRPNNHAKNCSQAFAAPAIVIIRSGIVSHIVCHRLNFSDYNLQLFEKVPSFIAVKHSHLLDGYLVKLQQAFALRDVVADENGISMVLFKLSQ